MFIFAITKNDKVLNTFLEKNYEQAKLYFQGAIYEEKNTQDYKLFKIAEIDNKLKINSMKVFIIGGYEITQKQKFERQKVEQIKLNYKKAAEEKETIKIINNLFEGKIIK